MVTMTAGMNDCFLKQFELFFGWFRRFSPRLGFYGEETMGAGQGVDFFFPVASGLIDVHLDVQTVEGVADVFEFVVIVLAAMGEVVLEAFQQIGGEVRLTAFGIAVGGDVGEALFEELAVAWLTDGYASFVHPVGRPCERFDQGLPVAVPVFLFGLAAAAVEAAADGAEELPEGLFFGCFHCACAGLPGAGVEAGACSQCSWVRQCGCMRAALTSCVSAVRFCARTA